MQISEIRCQKCGGEMEAGFLVDIVFPGNLSVDPQGEDVHWAKGSRSEIPKPGLLSRLTSGIGFSVRDVHTRPVTSLRCTACGYLELYAQ